MDGRFRLWLGRLGPRSLSHISIGQKLHLLGIGGAAALVVITVTETYPGSRTGTMS